MAKKTSQFVCQQCGYAQTGWAGKCPECGTWGSLVETLIESQSSGSKKSGYVKAKSTSLTTINAGEIVRTATSIPELDSVLGGGIVPGQAILIAGEPGIGKSTILLQISNSLVQKGFTVLYVGGEESASQIKIRADRLGVLPDGIEIIETPDIDSVIEMAEEQQGKILLIVDSIQTVTTSDLSGMAGSVGQVRESSHRLVQYAKRSGNPVLIVGHVTKEGSVAGPSALAHVVDTVLWFEGDKTLSMRMLRAIKNRFGSTDEVGIFMMDERGLVSASDIQDLFMSETDKNVPGNTITCILQGTRPILVEIQALVVPTKLAIPRRVAQGIDAKRLEMLLAVLTRRAGVNVYEHDVYVNVVGGINLAKDPSVDLAVCLAIASSAFDNPLPKNTVAIGEVGLLGDIRRVSSLERRIKEAKRMGYTKVVGSNEKKLYSIVQALFTKK